MKPLISLLAMGVGYACNVLAVDLSFRLSMAMPTATSVHDQFASVGFGDLAVPAYLSVLQIPTWSMALVAGLAIGLALRRNWLRVAVCWGLGFAVLPHILLLALSDHPWTTVQASELSAAILQDLVAPVAIESFAVWVARRMRVPRATTPPRVAVPLS